jgi:anti-sigma factor RsiW
MLEVFGMDCRDAQFYLRLHRHTADELGAELTADLDRHIAGCAHCAAESRSITRIDRALATAMQNVPIPGGLRERLVAKLSAQRGTVLRRKAYRYVGVAAALFLTVGIGFGMFWQGRPQADTTDLVHNLDKRADPAQAEADVQKWLRSKNLPDRLPEPFDYRLYVMHGTEPVQGRDVPVIIFRDPSGGEFAKVYAFRDGEFDLKAIAPAQASYWQSHDYPAGRGVVFVIAYTGGTLKPFLKPGSIG